MLFVSSCYWIRDLGKRLLCDRTDFRDLARVQEGICDTAEGSPDVESEDEFSRRARVGGTRCMHDRNRSKTRDRGCYRSIARGLKYLSGSRHTFLLQVGGDR